MSIDLQIQRVHPSHVQIQSHLRQQIQTGALKPGERLPTNMELARKWGVSCTAVQKALAGLTVEGLLARAPRRGTHVRTPTEKATIGILFGPSLSDETAHFYRSIHKALRAEIDARNATCRAYDGLSIYEGSSSAHRVQVHKQLKSDLRNHSFQGLIQISPDTQWPQEIDSIVKLPKARWSVTHQQTDCRFDGYQLGRDSVRFLARCGHKSFAYLRTVWHLAPHYCDDLDGLLDTVKELGLPKPQIEQVVLTAQGKLQERQMEERTEQLIRAWNAHTGRKHRPDALIVSDDIVMRGVALAVIRNDVRVPEQIRVLCFASEGINLHYGVPVVRFEYPTSAIARHLTDLLWKRIQGEPDPALP